MSKSNLYTRTGDDGSTSLVGGQRTPKDCLRLEAYGTIDELSSHLGVILSSKTCPEEVRGQLIEIQNLMFDIGCSLATAPEDGNKYATRDIAACLPKLEGWIDALDEQTPKMNAFVLPGGCPLCAEAHVARTVCRRAERCILALSRQEWVNAAVLKYVNRLSDYLFILARYFNFISGVDEIVWNKK